MIRFDTFGDAGWSLTGGARRRGPRRALHVGSATENVFHLAQQGAQQGLVIDLCGGLQFLQQLALALAQLGGNQYADLDIQIAAAVSIQHRHALVFDAEGTAGLGAVRDFENVFAFHRRHANLRAHRGLCHGQRDHAVQVVVLAFEKWMFLDVQHNVEIAGRTAELANLSASRKTNARAVFHSRGNSRIDGALPQHASLAFALGARICDHAARSLASWAGARNAEEALLIAHLSPPGARLAGAGSFTGRGARAATFFAGFVAAHVNLGFGAKECLLEFQRQVFAQIGSALHPAAAPSASAAKGIAETEELAEDFADILETRGVEAAALPRTTQSRVPVAVVYGALF